jgi:hypothetical protein
MVSWSINMLWARRGLAAASLVLTVSSSATVTRAADKVRCAAAYEQGQELRRQDKLSASRSQLLICEQTCPRTLVADCTKWRNEVEALMPTVRLRASDGQGRPVEARVLLDGTLLLERLAEEPVPVDSGDHTFHFESPSGVTADVSVSLHGGERAREVEAILAPPVVTPPPAPHLVPTSSYVLGAVGVAGLATAGGFSLVGHVDAGHLRSTCAPGCAPGQVSSIATLYDVGWVSAGVGVASLAVALVLWKPWQRTPATVTSGLFVAPTIGGALIGWTLR